MAAGRADLSSDIDASSRASGRIVLSLTKERFLLGLSLIICFSLSVARNK